MSTAVTGAPATGGQRRQIIGIVIAAVVLVGVVVTVLAIGGLSLPSYPALGATDALSPQGLVAITTTEDDARWDEPPCLDVVDLATGEQRRLRCLDDWVSGLGWDDATTIGIDVAHDQRVGIDAVTGDVMFDRARPGGVRDEQRPTTTDDGRSLRTTARRDDSRVVVTADGTAVDLLESPRPRTYTFTQAWWAPDQRHVLIRDSARRLLIVDAESPGTAALVATDVEGAAIAPLE